MPSTIRVEPEALTAEGLGLADTQAPITPPLAVAPAADPVSLGVSAVLDAHSGALAMVAEHSGALRAHGGAVLSQAGAAFRTMDDENAALLAAVINGTAPASPSMPALPVPAVEDPSALPHGWHIEESQVAPWFGQPGGGTQFRVIAPNGGDASVDALIRSGFLRRVGG